MKQHHIGYDKNGTELNYGDICKFKLKLSTYDTINNQTIIELKEYKGMIVYDEDTFSYAFKMKDDYFPIVLMNKANLGSIEKIINVIDENLPKEYEFFSKVYCYWENNKN